MRSLRASFLVLPFLLGLAGPPALAISGSDMSGWAAPPSGDAELDAGRAAFDRQDWPGVVENISAVVDRRPWDDAAHTMLGFAYRKLGHYDLSLAHYDKALELNPHNRGALEYLGEAYLEMERPHDARRTLDRLGLVCRRIAAPEEGARRSECEEWQELKAAYDAYLATGAAPDDAR